MLHIIILSFSYEMNGLFTYVKDYFVYEFFCHCSSYEQVTYFLTYFYLQCYLVHQSYLV